MEVGSRSYGKCHSVLDLRTAVVKVEEKTCKKKDALAKAPTPEGGTAPSHDYPELSETGPRKVAGVLSPVLPMLSLHVQG